MFRRRKNRGGGSGEVNLPKYSHTGGERIRKRLFHGVVIPTPPRSSFHENVNVRKPRARYISCVENAQWQIGSSASPGNDGHGETFYGKRAARIRVVRARLYDCGVTASMSRTFPRAIAKEKKQLNATNKRTRLRELATTGWWDKVSQTNKKWENGGTA